MTDSSIMPPYNDTNITTKLMLIENEKKHIEDALLKFSDQINKLREDTAMQAAQISNIERDIEKLEEIVYTYRGKIDSNCDFVGKYDEKYGSKIDDILHDIAILKTTMALNATTASSALLYPSSLPQSLPSNYSRNEQIIQTQTIDKSESKSRIDLSSAGKLSKKSIDSISDTFMKIGAIILSLASFIAGFFKI